jgi:hypothetical protein
MLAPQAKKYHFCGQPVSAQEMEVVKSVISDCSGISRTELASTLCEILDWRRQNGKLKTVECRAFLEELDEKSILQLPVRRQCGRARGSRTSVGEDSVLPVAVLEGWPNSPVRN